jgi:uncharacterized protein
MAIITSSQNTSAGTPVNTSLSTNIKYLLVGAFFGLVLSKSEATSWYRMQEMFKLQSFHMFGIIGSAIAVGLLSLYIIKRFNVKTFKGDTVSVKSDPFSKGYVIGGFLFGIGWAFTGACPGPIFALLGSGMSAAIVLLASALLGTWTYGMIRDKLPH